MTRREKLLAGLLERALRDLVEHKNEYHHVGEAGLIDEIRTTLKDFDDDQATQASKAAPRNP